MIEFLKMIFYMKNYSEEYEYDSGEENLYDSDDEYGQMLVLDEEYGNVLEFKIYDSTNSDNDD